MRGFRPDNCREAARLALFAAAVGALGFQAFNMVTSLSLQFGFHWRRTYLLGGDDIIEPIYANLNYLTPITVGVVGLLFALSWRQKVKRPALFALTAMVLLMAAGGIGFGEWFFHHELLDRFHFSDRVWWLPGRM